MLDLNIIIPVYNESEIIRFVTEDWIHTLESLNIKYKIKLYNDGSTDDSLAALHMLQNEHPDIIKVIDKKNSGHGPTVLKAYNDNLDSEWLFQVDSDNEIPACYFKEFWNTKDHFDLIIGKRKGRNSPFFRKLMTAISYWAVFLFYGSGIKDTNAPYRLIRVQSFEKDIKEIPTNVFTPNIIISGVAVKNKMKIKVFDVNHNHRKTGSTSLGKNLFKLLKVSFKSFKEVILYAIRH